FASGHRQQIGGDRLETLAAGPAGGGGAGPEQIADRHEVAVLAATVLVALPLLGGVVVLDRKRPVAGLLSFPAVEEAASPRFAGDSVQLGEQSTVVASYVFKAELRHQLIDVHEFLFGRHWLVRKKGGM